MVKLAKARGANMDVRISPESVNRSLLLLGVSGSGKTNALRCLERNLAEDGACVLAVNFRSTHPYVQGEMTRRIHMRSDGFPFPILCPIERPDGSVEDIDDAVEATLDVFDNVVRLPVLQKKVLREAFFSVVNAGKMVDTMQGVVEYLEEKNDEPSQRVMEKFRPIFRKMKFSLPGESFISRGQISILDLEDFTDYEQRFITELTLSVVWRYFRIWGPKATVPLYMVLDEFQGLSLRSESVLTQMLREGRKFNVALVLATQTLDMFDRTQIATVIQPATHLFFQPAANETRRIGKLIGGKDIKALSEELCSLRRGECVATGKFQIGGLVTERPIRVQFPRYDIPTLTRKEGLILWAR